MMYVALYTLGSLFCIAVLAMTPQRATTTTALTAKISAELHYQRPKARQILLRGRGCRR